MIATKPVGVLGWSDEDHAEYELNGKWPQRAAEVPNTPGLSLTGQQENWRFLDEQEVLRKARSEIAREAGMKSGRARQAAPWRGPATELAKAACAKDATASNEDIATEIAAGWKCKSLECPGHRTLEKLVSARRADGTLPKRTSSLPK